MDQLQPISQTAAGLASQIIAILHGLVLPARLDQLLLLAALVAAAHLIGRYGGRRLYRWMKTLAGHPKWQLRALLVIRQRLTGLAFVVLAWVSVGVVAEITPFPSRRYVLTVAATLATGWLVVAFAGPVIRNRFLRRLVTWGAWTYVTLHILGLVASTSAFLDEFAIDLGGFHLSALAILKALVVTGILIAGARFLSQTATANLSKNEDLSPSMRVLSVKLLQVVLYGSAFFIGLKAVGFDLTGLAVLSGAIGVGLGFGLQKVVSNLVSGVIILLDKSVKPGDVISLGETFGWIEALGARYVSVVTRDGKEYLIPNEDLITGQVVNWSHSNDFVRLDIFFGAAYGDDPHVVRKIAVDACRSVRRVLKTRSPVCHIVGFGDSSVNYILRFWIRDPTEGLTNVRGDVYLALWDAFKENGVSIPFPQREVRVLGDTPLHD
ncbi:MAG: mechanosensitive ion channel [Rhodobacteraceae bacterium]|nr:mechanosensitive ion channel [Paracoccaceae bacterium]